MNTLSPLVSVIIPVYNAGICLSDCLQSVISQSYTSLEIILVNDGSTDNSKSIAEQFARTDERIQLINKPNEGPALARKAGIDVASGKYIQFLDSDDTLLSDAIERLVGKAEISQADIVAAPFFFCTQGIPDTPSVPLDFIELSGLDYFKRILQRKAYWSVWSNFQKRSLFLDNHIETVSHISIGEDGIQMLQLLLFAHKVVPVEGAILRYNRHPSSITYLGNVNEKRFRDLREHYIWMENYIREKGLEEELGKEIAALHILSTFDSLYWQRADFVHSDMKQLKRDLKCFPELMELLDKRQLKLIKAYRVSRLWGDYRMHKYYPKAKK